MFHIYLCELTAGLPAGMSDYGWLVVLLWVI